MNALELIVLWFLRGFLCALFAVCVIGILPALLGMAAWREAGLRLARWRIGSHV